MSRPAPLLPATSVDDAVASVMSHARACAPLAQQEIALPTAHGRVLGRSRRAQWPMPATDVSMMDGWAVRAADLADASACGSTVTLTASGHSAAGHPSDQPLLAGQTARIFTGAVLPAGADAVVAQEDAETTEHREQTLVRIDADAVSRTAPGRFVRRAGSEIKPGDLLVDAGTRLRPAELAVLASAGHAVVPVVTRPRVAILSNGDELVPLGQAPGPGQVVSSNGIMLAAQVVEAGGEPVVLPEVGDDRDALRAALAEGLDADVLVTSGGISVGDHDGVRPELLALGVQLHWHGVALRPGKPTAFGVHQDTLVFGLPGNPASSWVAFSLFVAPAIAVRSGQLHHRPPLALPVTVTHAIPGSAKRTHYVRAQWATASPETDEGLPAVTPLSAQRSGNLRSIADVDVLIVVAMGSDGVAAGQRCRGIVLRPPPEPSR